MRPWLCAGYWSAETLILKSLHVYANIHVLLLASHTLVFGIYHGRDVKIPSSIIGVVRGQRGIHILHPR